MTCGTWLAAAYVIKPIANTCVARTQDIANYTILCAIGGVFLLTNVLLWIDVYENICFKSCVKDKLVQNTEYSVSHVETKQKVYLDSQYTEKAGQVEKVSTTQGNDKENSGTVKSSAANLIGLSKPVQCS